MKNFHSLGGTITIAAAAVAVASGGGLLTGHLFGVAKSAALQGAQVVVETLGCFGLPKHAGDVFAVGDLVYWDDANKVVTSTAANNHLIGCAVAPAIAGDAGAVVRLNGVTVA